MLILVKILLFFDSPAPAEWPYSIQTPPQPAIGRQALLILFLVGDAAVYFCPKGSGGCSDRSKDWKKEQGC